MASSGSMVQNLLLFVTSSVSVVVTVEVAYGQVGVNWEVSSDPA